MTERAVELILWQVAQHDEEAETLGRRIGFMRKELAALTERRDAHLTHAGELREALDVLRPRCDAEAS